MAVVYYVCTIHPETEEITFERFHDDMEDWENDKRILDLKPDKSDDTIWVCLKGHYDE